jgi:hypothetical protein
MNPQTDEHIPEASAALTPNESTHLQGIYNKLKQLSDALITVQKEIATKEEQIARLNALFDPITDQALGLTDDPTKFVTTGRFSIFQMQIANRGKEIKEMKNKMDEYAKRLSVFDQDFNLDGPIKRSEMERRIKALEDAAKSRDDRRKVTVGKMRQLTTHDVGVTNQFTVDTSIIKEKDLKHMLVAWGSSVTSAM